MKIGPIETKPPSVAPADRKAEAAPAKAPAAPSTEVALSAAATGLAAGTAEASFDGAKVERIAAAIREGRFTVNPEAIADKLITNAEELLGRKLS
jgi:negative regulator of flagellin synthesis FlgM